MNKLDFYNIKTGDMIDYSYLDMKNRYIVTEGYSPITNCIIVKRKSSPDYIGLRIYPEQARSVELVEG